MTKKDELLATLTERFPAAFPSEPKAIRPLKIGIHQDVQDALPEVDSKALHQALAHHVRRLTYLRAIERGGERIDLDGNPVEPVTAEQQAFAAEKLKEAKARLKAKQEAKQAAQASAEPPPKANKADKTEVKGKPLEAEKTPQVEPEGSVNSTRPILTLKKKPA